MSSLTGEVVYLYAFDVAYEMVRRPIASILGKPIEPFEVEASKPGPRQAMFSRPQMVRLPELQRVGPHGPMTLSRTIKLLNIGALSITVRAKFEVDTIEQLINYHDLRFADGSWLYDSVRELAEQVRAEVSDYLIRPVEKLGEEEAYTVFCLNAPMRSPDGAKLTSEDWLTTHRRSVAGLLTEERESMRLSESEAIETSSKAFSYYEQDLVVIDWDAALIIDEPRYFDETLYIMELANIQLAELEAYDRLLDESVVRAYRDISSRTPKARRMEGQLREIRIDLARLSDELSNITKFLGDWHLARIYQGLASRFHLVDWHRVTDEKLKTLDDLYQLLRADRNNRWMLWLEITIVLLFIIDVVALFYGVGK